MPLLFIFTLLLNLAADYLPVPYLESVTKPLLMIILINWFISATENLSSRIKRWIIMALCFSWLGDVLLMFQEKDSMFFLSGLGSFLCAHIFYILFFHRIKKEEGVTARSWFALPVMAYYASLMTVLYPRLADMKMPVLVYGIVISFMLLLAMHMLFIKNKLAGRWMFTGALLFIVSDSVLAFNKFYQPFQSAGLIIMLTYGLAQLFITAGAIQYLRGKSVQATDEGISRAVRHEI